MVDDDDEGWEELFGEGGGIQKRVVVDGVGDIAEYHRMAEVRYTGRLLSTGAVFEGPRCVKTRVGAGDLVPGLELAVRNMRAGERSRVRCESKFGYGPAGRTGGTNGAGAVPVDAALEYDAELLSVGSCAQSKEEEEASMRPCERLVRAAERKSEGNHFFAVAEFDKAVRCYREVLFFLAGEEQRAALGEADGARAAQLLVDGGNNLAAAYLKLGDPKQAVLACGAVLEVDASNAKARFRHAQAALALGDFAGADEALRAAATASKTPREEAAVRAEQQKLERRRRAHARKERRMFGNLLHEGKGALADERSATGGSEGAGAGTGLASGTATAVDAGGGGGGVALVSGSTGSSGASDAASNVEVEAVAASTPPAWWQNSSLRHALVVIATALVVAVAVLLGPLRAAH